MDGVSNVVFRERYDELRSRGVSDRELAERAGWLRRCKGGDTKMVGDTARLRRYLGLQREGVDHRTGQGGGFRTYVRYDTAVRLAAALDLDPVDVGI